MEAQSSSLCVGIKLYPPLHPYLFLCSRLQGQYRQTLENPNTVVGATKWCVFAATTITRAVVEEAVKERIERMKRSPVDLLQVSPSACVPSGLP